MIRIAAMPLSTAERASQSVDTGEEKRLPASCHGHRWVKNRSRASRAVSLRGSQWDAALPLKPYSALQGRIIPAARSTR
ncbi:hypothetical protein [Paenibacillus chungangensis]|uniref:hypothetical protein n=1 Tax=Paenibacillus chungangensis TaxID=696535 RepID=UPI0036725E96